MSDERYRHVKRGTVYEVVGRAELQVNNIALCDGVTMVIYRGDDGKLWVRGEAEFMDGRFEIVADVISAHPSERVAAKLDKVVDWGKPLEAYHTDGRILPAWFLCHASGETADVRFDGRKENALMPSGYVGDGWRIRNATPATSA